MSFSEARGAVIEIIENRREPIEDTLNGSVLTPDEIRINGQPLLCSANHPIKVHEIGVPAQGVVLVTLTVFARRVEIRADETV